MTVRTKKYDNNNRNIWQQQLEGVKIVKKGICLAKPFIYKLNLTFYF